MVLARKALDGLASEFDSVLVLACMDAEDDHVVDDGMDEA